MRILNPGSMDQERVGTCKLCQCRVAVKVKELKRDSSGCSVPTVVCPTNGCGQWIFLECFISPSEMESSKK
jgi:hypothetical protein